MKDKREPVMARIKAATELLNRGYGRPPQSIEVLTPSSEIPEFLSHEEIYAEVRRRGLLPILELVAQEMESEDRGSHHTAVRPKTQPHLRGRDARQSELCEMIELHATSNSKSRSPGPTIQFELRERKMVPRGATLFAMRRLA
jgi:hypothetical protein